MSTLIEYNSPEYNILLDAFQNTKLDKWIAQSIESFIYEWKEERYDNGTLKERYLTRFGEKEGEFKSWFSNSQLNIHCYYKEGKLEGEYKSWDDNGQLRIHCYCKEGKLEGEYKKWYRVEGDEMSESQSENEQLDIHCHYKEGKWEGEYKQWWDNGKLYTHCHYKECKREGDYKEWNEEGVLIKDEVYHNGEKITDTIAFGLNRVK